MRILPSFIILMITLQAPNAEARKRKSHQDDGPSLFSELTVSAPTSEEVCFSPNEPCEVKIVKFVKNAKKSIDVAIYDINLDDLVGALVEQSKKIPVRIIVDRKQSKGPHSKVAKLIEAGAKVRYGIQKGTGIMHDKFIIVDGVMVETGSFNYTHHASRSNQENQIYLDSPKVVKRYHEHYEQMWALSAIP